MKLSGHAFTRFWDVHAWLGVTAGLVLHVMFFAGAFTLFYEELGVWQERDAGAPASTTAPLAPLVERVMRERRVTPQVLDFTLPSGKEPFVELGWRSKGGKPEEVRLNLHTGEAVPQASHLARILFQLHFLYHPKATWGMYVAGVFGVALLLALVTGVLIHLKDIVRQFHQFRPRKAVKVLWSDMHKVLGVMGLPFQLVYALTGAFIALGSVLVTVVAGPVFGGDQAAASAAVRGRDVDAKPTGKPAVAMDIDQVRRRAVAAVPGFVPRFVQLSNLGDEAALARLWGEAPGSLFGHGEIVLRATDGVVLSQTVTVPPTPGAAIERWMVGLHYVWFGGLAAKIFYALLALATCLTILSGNWIWLMRRESRRQGLGNRLLARLTIGMGGGVAVAAAALFWANRIAPAPWRMAAESWAFFGTWAAVTVAFLVRAEVRGGWSALLRISGAAFVALPLGSLVGGASAVAATRPSRPDLLGVEVGLVLFGLWLWGAAAVVTRRMASRAAEQARPALEIVGHEAT